MKLCWDNLKNLRLTKNGNLKRCNTSYVEMDSCRHCGNSYLTIKWRPSYYCTRSCALSGGRHPLYNKHPSELTRKRMSKSAIRRGFANNPNYKGGVEKMGIPLFDTFSSQISCADETRQKALGELIVLEVRCTYCGKWFMPTIIMARARIAALNRAVGVRSCGEGRFYCSHACKKSCPIFQRRKYPKEFKVSTSREVQPQLRKMVFERDNHTCQKCGKDVNESQIHCHHIDPVSQNPIESADIDNCITFCRGCHEEIHKQVGCRLYELGCD